MAVSLDVLIGPRLKVTRALGHIAEIRDSTIPLNREWYSFGVEKEAIPPYKDRFRYALRYRPLRPIAKTVALMIGDTVHNLRGALDHLCTGIARTEDPTSALHFPMMKDRSDLESAKASSGAGKSFAAMEKVLPGAKTMFFKDLRPSEGSEEALWIALQSFDNDDKHNLILPAVAATAINNINASFGIGGAIRDLTIGNDADFVFGALTQNDPIAFGDNFYTSTEVKFPDGGILGGALVIPALTEMAVVVTKTIDAFEILIRTNS